MFAKDFSFNRHATNEIYFKIRYELFTSIDLNYRRMVKETYSRSRTDVNYRRNSDLKQTQ
jgi:hypothetical protein